MSKGFTRKCAAEVIGTYILVFCCNDIHCGTSDSRSRSNDMLAILKK